jgi:hypothetical protein
MKSIKKDNFVGIYDEFFSNQFCDNLIDYYEWCAKNNKSWNRTEDERFKKDNATSLNPTNVDEINFIAPNLHSYLDEFNQVFWNECYSDYRQTYSVLNDYSAHTIYTYKIQKTQPAGGYHVWHCEDPVQDMSRRMGVYILFLNDVEEGGETEFLYFSQRIKAKKGRLIIFPPNYPWAHRGNPPLSNTKYILTGWLEFR